MTTDLPEFDRQVRLHRYITYGRERGHEERWLEYKSTMNWKDNATKGKIGKAIAAMSNIENGGVIAVGVNPQTYEPDGMASEDAASFDQDTMSEWLNDKLEPEAQFHVNHLWFEGKQFVVIEVQEFTDVPLICRRPLPGQLKEGAIYIRGKGKYESAQIATQSDMRDLIRLATDKALAKEIARLRKLGLIPLVEERPWVEHERMFEEEREGL